MAEVAPAPPEGAFVSEALMIARYHIVLVAMAATVTFGWIMTGRYPFAVALVCGLDWFLINLMNRITDIGEDLKNGIPGTARVARAKSALTVLAAALMISSFAVTAFVWPWLTVARVAVQLIGLAYNYRLVPTPKGLRRLKEIYFFKNFMSAVIFVLTGFVYPALASGTSLVVPLSTMVALALFFVPFELTYEILYDLRDLDGDRAEGIPTYPVVHGPEAARKIIDALLVLAALVLLGAFALRVVGVRELLMLVAPLAQLLFYRPRLRRGLTTPDCVALTHLGTSMLALFLVGTWAWLRAGLPANVWLGG